jgi:anaerobic magnesium-protoporphyrin IX monomethyl ester cyclase
MRVTFLEPPLAPYRTGIVPRHPPQYALYAASVLRNAGHSVSFVDAFLADLTIPETIRQVVATSPEMVVIVPWDYTRETMPEVSQSIARRLGARLPGVPLVLAGSVDVENFRMQMEAVEALSMAIIGEYDEALLQVVQSSRRGLADLPGLLLRSGRANEIIFTGPGSPVADLDSVPWPAWDLVDFRRYTFIPHRFKQTPMYPILASRGCPFACRCCKEAKYSKITRFRLRTVANVMAEINFAKAQWGAREIQFSDATFGLDPHWVMELCEALTDSGLTWSALSRVDVMTPELLQGMARAGCWNVLYGLESANQESLDIVGKKIRVEQAAPILRATKEAGIEVTASFILGLPGEGRAEIQRTIEWACELNPDYAQFFILKHFGDEGEFDDWGQVEKEWDLGRFDFRGPVFVSSKLSGKAELKQLQKLAYKRFYLRPSYLARRLPRLLHPHQLMRHAQGLWTLLQAV